MRHTLSLFALLLLASPGFAQPKPPFPYVWGTAHHILPGTHTDESGYFSLCEGKNGKIYVGTAAYGFNAYLIEFDPKTGTYSMPAPGTLEPSSASSARSAEGAQAIVITPVQSPAGGYKLTIPDREQQ